MIQPDEFKKDLPMEVHGGAISTTARVWSMLTASRDGSLGKVKELAAETPGLIYAQYTYDPPIHFAVREGHVPLVKYLLLHGALAPDYKTYPFLDSLMTVADDRGHFEIVELLKAYLNDPMSHKLSGDNGKIFYERTVHQNEFQEAVDKGDLPGTERILKTHPDLVQDRGYFWGEGIMAVPANRGDRPMLELLLRYGAKVPDLLKWTQAYYFKHYEIAGFLMNNGMNPNVMNWHEVRLLHDMAQKGFVSKARLLIEHGADIDPLEDEYQSTPLGMAARWGHGEMVEYLLAQGADPNKSGAAWSTPLAWARKKDHQEIEKMLLAAGADNL